VCITECQIQKSAEFLSIGGIERQEKSGRFQQSEPDVLCVYALGGGERGRESRREREKEQTTVTAGSTARDKRRQRLQSRIRRADLDGRRYPLPSDCSFNGTGQQAPCVPSKGRTHTHTHTHTLLEADVQVCRLCCPAARQRGPFFKPGPGDASGHCR